MYETEVLVVITIVILIIVINEVQIVYGQELVLFRDLLCCARNQCRGCCRGERDLKDIDEDVV